MVADSKHAQVKCVGYWPTLDLFGQNHGWSMSTFYNPPPPPQKKKITTAINNMIIKGVGV